MKRLVLVLALVAVLFTAVTPVSVNADIAGKFHQSPVVQLQQSLDLKQADAGFLEGTGWAYCYDVTNGQYLGDVPERYQGSYGLAHNYCVTHF